MVIQRENIVGKKILNHLSLEDPVAYSQYWKVRFTTDAISKVVFTAQKMVSQSGVALAFSTDIVSDSSDFHGAPLHERLQGTVLLCIQRRYSKPIFQNGGSSTLWLGRNWVTGGRPAANCRDLFLAWSYEMSDLTSPGSSARGRRASRLLCRQYINLHRMQCLAMYTEDDGNSCCSHEYPATELVYHRKDGGPVVPQYSSCAVPTAIMATYKVWMNTNGRRIKILGVTLDGCRTFEAHFNRPAT